MNWNQAGFRVRARTQYEATRHGVCAPQGGSYGGGAAEHRGAPLVHTGTTIPKKNREVPKGGGKTVWKSPSAAGPFSWDQNEAPCAWGLVCSCPGSAGADAQGPRIAL